MTDVTITFHLDPALKAAFVAMASEQDVSVAQVLRQIMRDAVARHAGSATHERWQRREIGDALCEADASRALSLSNEMVDEDWRLRKAELGHDDR